MENVVRPSCSHDDSASPSRRLLPINWNYRHEIRNYGTSDHDPFLEEGTPDPVIMTASLNPDPNAENPLKKAARKCCTKKMLKRKLPIVEWLPRYRFGHLKGDLIAGLTVGLTVIPQGIAYAGIAGLPPQYGLYASFMGAFVYIFFGSIKSLSIGPTAIISLLTAEYVEKGGPQYAIVLCFLGGCVQLLMGVLNLGTLVSFISGPVISAFTSSAAIIIAASQLKGLFGLKFHSHSFVTTIYHTLANIKDTNLWDLVMGITVIIFLLLLRALKLSEWPKNSTVVPQKIKKPLKGFIWIVSTGKNAVAIMVCVGVALAFLKYDIGNLSLTGEVQAGLPAFRIPPFHYKAFNNATNQTVEITFVDICEDLGAGLVIVPLISVIESIAIAKIFSGGKRLDASQELTTLGIANIAAAFFSSYPITGSFSRSAINATSGVQTTFGGFFTGVLVLIALGVLAPFFKYIPKAALSGMILVAVVFMVHFGIIISLWKVKKSDLVPYFITFLCCLGFGLKYGMLVGVGISILMLLYHHANLNLLMQEFVMCDTKCLRVQPDRGVFYPSSEKLQRMIKKNIKDGEKVIIVFDAIHMQNADYTTMSILKQMIDEFQKNDQIILFINVRDDLFDLFKLIEVTELRISRDPFNLENMIKDALASQKTKENFEAVDVKIKPDPNEPSEKI